MLRDRPLSSFILVGVGLNLESSWLLQEADYDDLLFIIIMKITPIFQYLTGDG